MAPGRRRPQHARTAIVRDPERGSWLCPGSRAFRTPSLAGVGQAGDCACSCGLAGRLVYDHQGSRRRDRFGALRGEPAGLAARRPSAGLSARPRQHEPAVGAPPGNPGASGRGGAGRFLPRRDRALDRRRGEARRRLSGRRRPGPLSCPCRPGTHDPISRHIVSDRARDDRRADIGRGSRQTIGPAFCRRSRRRLFRNPGRSPWNRLCGAAGKHGGRRNRLADLDDAHHCGRPKRRHRSADDDIAVFLRQSICAGRYRNPDEQRRDVVRPTPGTAEFDGARKARPNQYVPGCRCARRPAVVRRRRFRWPENPWRGAAIGELHRRFRHGSRDRGPSPAHRCQWH